MEDFETHAGRILKIVTVDDETGAVHARQTDGQVTRFTVLNGTLPEPEDIVLLGPNRWELAPDDLWVPASRQIGIVRRLFDKDEILVEDAIRLQLIRNPRRLSLAINNTVEFDDEGVLRLIAATPIRARDNGLDNVDVGSTYRVDTTQGGPTFADFGGYPKVVERARELIDTQMRRRSELAEIGARPVKGILFTGSPGTGKTHLARIIAQESNADFYLVSGPSIVSKWVGESEETLRRIFEAATSSGDNGAIVFFDEIDSIAERRGGESHEASRRLVAQLLTLMDGFDRTGSNVIVIAATNRVEVLDPALTRPGRFDWEISFGLPNVLDRYQILRVSAANLQTDEYLPLEDIASLTENWSAAELSSIWAEAALVAAAEGRTRISAEDTALAFERAYRRPRQILEGRG